MLFDTSQILQTNSKNALERKFTGKTGLLQGQTPNTNPKMSKNIPKDFDLDEARSTDFTGCSPRSETPTPELEQFALEQIHN